MLRPTAGVGEVYREVQDAALARLGIPTRHPHTGHVTLRGFYEPERREELAEVIRAWAARQSPIEVIAEAELVWYQGGIEHAEVLPLRG